MFASEASGAPLATSLPLFHEYLSDFSASLEGESGVLLRNHLAFRMEHTTIGNYRYSIGFERGGCSPVFAEQLTTPTPQQR